jgi:hypothetical protein
MFALTDITHSRFVLGSSTGCPLIEATVEGVTMTTKLSGKQVGTCDKPIG